MGKSGVRGGAEAAAGHHVALHRPSKDSVLSTMRCHAESCEQGSKLAFMWKVRWVLVRKASNGKRETTRRKQPIFPFGFMIKSQVKVE